VDILAEKYVRMRGIHMYPYSTLLLSGWAKFKLLFLRSMLKILYADCRGLFPAIPSQFTIEMCAAI